MRNLVAVGFPTAVFVSDLSYFALFATKQNPHYVEMVLIVTVAELVSGGGGGGVTLPNSPLLQMSLRPISVDSEDFKK